MGFITEYAFWVAQGFAIMAAFMMVYRMGLSDRRQFNLFHTYMCIPLFIQFVILGSWMMAVFCVVGGIRTLLISTRWGHDRRAFVIGLGLCCMIAGGVVAADSYFDWFLLLTNTWAITSEGLKSFKNQRIANFVNTFAWCFCSFFDGAYVTGVAHLMCVVNNMRAMERDFKLVTMVRGYLGCRKSRHAYLAYMGQNAI